MESSKQISPAFLSCRCRKNTGAWLRWIDTSQAAGFLPPAGFRDNSHERTIRNAYPAANV